MGTRTTGQRRPAPGRTVLTRTPARIAISEVILNEPSATWTVAEVCGRFRGRNGPSAETVRATLYVLATEGILRETRVGNTLRFSLDAPGAARLRTVMRVWGGEPRPTRSDPPGHATMVTQTGRRLWLSTSAEHRCDRPEDHRDATATACRWCDEHALMLVAQGDRHEASVMTMMGALVSATAGLVCDAVAFVLRGPVRTLVLDASGVVTVDRSGLRAVGGLQRSALTEQRSLLVHHKEPTSPIGQRLREAGILSRPGTRT